MSKVVEIRLIIFAFLDSLKVLLIVNGIPVFPVLLICYVTPDSAKLQELSNKHSHI